MKTKKILFVILIVFFANFLCNAGILVVDNHFPTPAGSYATIQLAHNASVAGDTLMLTPSETEYLGITVAKLVHIVGNGWDRSSALLPNTRTTGFSFNIGSAGASITGCQINGEVHIYTNNITVRRNKCFYIGIHENCLNVSIIQNYIISGRKSGYLYLNYNCESRQCGTILDVMQNTSVFIANNIIQNTLNNQTYIDMANYGIGISFPSNSVVCNNIIKAEDKSIIFDMSGTSYSSHSVFNNIILQGAVDGLIGSKNNLCNITQLPATDGNKQNIDINSLFVDLANNDFHLKSGSPAIGAGYNGTDCGIYGGELGFVDKGVPGLPYIYYLDVPAVVNKKDGLNVTVKAKSGN